MTKSLFNFLNKSAVGRKAAYMMSSTNSASNTDYASEASSFKHRVITPDKARQCEKFLDGSLWVVLSVIATITSLLAYDFTIAFLPKEVDISTDIILLIVFWFFFIELIVASFVRRGYFLSFWFWLDFIAMISMIPDLVLLLAIFNAGEEDINIANTQASKAGKSGRSAVALKAIRMIRFSRLLRVLRVFRFFQTDDESVALEETNVADAGSTKVGQIVSEAVTKKVIVLVLVLVLVLPWMDPSGASYADASTTSAALFKKLINNGADYDDSFEAFDNVGVPILAISIGGTQYLDEADIINARRAIEMWTLSLGDDDYVQFDIRSNTLEEAALGMCLTLFAILIFATSTLFVTASTMNLVVQPIARLTELLMRMAGVIGLLGGAQTVENLMEDKDELFIVEALCERIMDIFGGGNTSYSGDKAKPNKAISMMASRKITQITSGDRIWEIDVKEKHRTSIIERKVNRSFKEFVKSEAREESIEQENWRELGSLESIIENPKTLYCLRMFMTSNLTINNLLFILEAQEWQETCRRKFKSLYNKYCDDRSPAQINLNKAQFQRITDIASNETVLTETVFEEAINETWALMELNVFKQFLKSDYCKFYVHMKQNDPVTLNQLQLSVPDQEENVQKDVIRSSEKHFPEYFATER